MNDIFIAAVQDDDHPGDNPWEATISVNGLPVTFKIDRSRCQCCV